MSVSTDQTSRDSAFWNSTYHKRVDRLFLPLSVRQNRIEDVFADFLAELVKRSGRETRPDQTTDRFGALLSSLEAGRQGLELPADDTRRDLVFRWLREELVRGERASNRRDSSEAKHSLIPLHLAVAERFGRPAGNLPAYGAFLYDMLSLGRDSVKVEGLLSRVWSFFDDSEGDPLAAVLELALREGEDEPFQPTSWPLPKSRLVRCPTHAEQFQKDVVNALRFKGVSRRTMLVWLYSLFTFYLATYFLRMSLAAERCSQALAASLKGEDVEYQPCNRCNLNPLGPSTGSCCSNRYSIILGERNYDHARLLKRYPYYTSQWQVAKSFLPDNSLRGVDEAKALELVLSSLRRAARDNPAELSSWFELLAESYPLKSDNVGRRMVDDDSTKWALTEEDRERALRIFHEGQASAFETLTLYLNFEDMDRSTNNMKEWQLYRALARHPIYGFARGRGEYLDYALGEGLLTALAHVHVAEFGELATVQTLETALESRGLLVVDAYRGELLKSLVNLGLVQDVADSGDAKQLTVLYKAGPER